MKSIITKGIIIIVAIGAIFVGYRLFFGSSTPSAPTDNLTSSAPAPTSTDPLVDTSVGNELLSILLNLRTIKLNDQIFSNSAFTSLRDFTITLAGNSPQGRPNPFAPIGTDPAISNNTDITNVPQTQASVMTASASNITKNTAVFNGVVANNTESFQAWFEWNTIGATTPAVATVATSFAGSVTSFSTPVLLLVANKDYTVKAFVKIGDLTLSGASVAFKTPAQ